MSQQLTFDACHPQKSIVIEACAGSGKTWLLVSRLVRLLLAGAHPHEILAITFTRKAAQEMRGRLDEVLLHFSICDEKELVQELMIRGMTKSEALAAVPVARSLFERVLANPRGLTIDTFHGWFARLLGAAPLGCGVPQGLTLRDDFKRLQDDCLEDWWTSLPQPEKKDLRDAYELLVRELGANNANELLIGRKGFLTAKSEWSRYANSYQERGLDVNRAIQDLSQLLEIESPLKTALDSPESLGNLMTLADHWKNGGVKDKNNADSVKDALSLLSHQASLDEVADALRPAFLTGEYELLKNLSASGDLKKSLKNLPHPEKIEMQIDQSRLHWAQTVLSHFHWRADHRAHRIHQAWVLVGSDILNHYQAKKEALRVQDFSDLEAYTAQLMLSSNTASYLQARLDARYKHLLVDEFQDTNPIQWQILLSWLNAYGQDESKPTVFLVGDPKQSIYRFRRADVRLFEQAKQYLHREYGAVIHPFNETRRNSPAVLQAVNQTFSLDDLPETYPFKTQSRNPLAKNEYSHGEVLRLPLIPYPEIAKLSGRHALDLPYVDINKEAKYVQSYQEALQVGKLILQIKVSRQVAWSDFLILLRSRTPLPQIERAFRDLGIPCDSPRQGGLLKTLEAVDLIALLSVLVNPLDDLSLAHVLRSPIYGLSDIDLMNLVQQKKSNSSYSLWQVMNQENSLWQEVVAQIRSWSEKAQRLPVHDLLDHIYATAQLRRRYVEASPVLQSEQVLSNLDAFLSLALDLDGGRYPSLTRFISELKKIKRGAEEESPDEGEASPDEESDDSIDVNAQRVRILTIHAAKGLEARFVILMNANSARSNQDHVGVMMNWLPEESAPNHMSPFFSGKPKDLARQHLREEEDRISQIENWNLLYVALTRAKESIYISGSAAKGKNPVSENSWYGRLLRAGIAEMDISQIPEQSIPVTAIAVPSDLQQYKDFVVDWQGHSRLNAYVEIPNLDFEQQFVIDLGVAFHAVMEHVMRIPLKSPNEMPSVDQLVAWLGLSSELAREARACALRVLQSSQAQGFFFDPNIIRSWEELDVSGADDRLLRIDRLVEMPEHLIILDYKLSIPEQGSELLTKYQHQLATYRACIQALRSDKPILSYLLSANGDILEVLG